MKHLLVYALGGLISLSSFTGAIYSRIQRNTIDKRADMVEAHNLESELLAENLIITENGRYNLLEPDTTDTDLEKYLEHWYLYQSYVNKLEKPDTIIGLNTSDMYEEREKVYSAIALFGLAIAALPNLRRKKST